VSLACLEVIKSSLADLGVSVAKLPSCAVLDRAHCRLLETMSEVTLTISTTEPHQGDTLVALLVYPPQTGSGRAGRGRGSCHRAAAPSTDDPRPGTRRDLDTAWDRPTRFPMTADHEQT
jgi:hypothetical protein